MGSLFLLTLRMINGQAWHWTSLKTESCLWESRILLLIFGTVEKKSSQPMIDFQLFRNPAFVSSAVVGLLG
ncbi:hypothetical protein HU830_06130 [Lactobacillus sp. DCY120]|uniref:Uncharacterized protein n=1 Tax=Bombilactobacillus apium TaxID=2675299 RepID=A0A850R7S0_9LACO|nr:hypothetical protein [Bombilactobacillus apium]NVY96732.1 hypothetical protein [Bombilactobacillus apium]